MLCYAMRQGESRGAPFAVFVATEAPAFLAAPRFAKFNLSTFAQLAAADPSLALPPPSAVTAGLLDQLVCSRAKVLLLLLLLLLLLNAFLPPLLFTPLRVRLFRCCC